MSRKSREKVIEELTDMGVDFDARESYDNLYELLKIETRNRKPSPGPQQPTEPETEPGPLSKAERTRLAELERMAGKGRAIDQPTSAEMIELSRLRARADIVEAVE